MKIFKYFDAYVQVVLILATMYHGLSGIGKSADFDIVDFLPGYVIVGSYQITSCLVNLFFINAKFKTIARQYYQRALLVTMVCAGISLPIGAGVMFLVALLFVGPVMAIYYCVICFSELKLINHEKEQSDIVI